jgi:hypothetical protein
MGNGDLQIAGIGVSPDYVHYFHIWEGLPKKGDFEDRKSSA